MAATTTKERTEVLSTPLITTAVRDELLWCSDAEFDARVDLLSVTDVLDLVQALQEAMAIEQQTFDSLNHQLSQAANDSAVQERLSTALCSSQARLARLCARNMRCFMQAVRAKQMSPAKEGELPGHQPRSTDVSPGRRGGSEEDTGTEEADEELDDEEGSEEGSGSSGFHSLPRPRAPRQGISATEQLPARVPSVDEILSSVKRLRNNHQEMVKTALKCNASANKSFLHRSPTHSLDEDDSESPLYENVVLNEDKPPAVGLIYENLNTSLEAHIYDKPKCGLFSSEQEKHSDDDLEAVYENINFSTGKKSSDAELSDDSTVYENIDGVCKNGKDTKVAEEVTYDIPWNTRPVYETIKGAESKFQANNNNYYVNYRENWRDAVPQSTRMLLSGQYDAKPAKDVDEDSLEDAGDEECADGVVSDHGSEPDIPSPDYGSDDEFACDEGLGESETANYYADEQGSLLPIILEEDEECSSMTSTSPDSFLDSSVNCSNQNSRPGASLNGSEDTASRSSDKEDYSDAVDSSETASKPEDSREKATIDSWYHKSASSNQQNNYDQPERDGKSPELLSQPLVQLVAENDTAPIDGCDSTAVDDVIPEFKSLRVRKQNKSKWTPWDPTTLLRKLYELKNPMQMPKENETPLKFEGYLEKFPTGKKESTFWRAWKRKFFRAKDGFLYCYQNQQSEAPLLTIQLMGGKVEQLQLEDFGKGIPSEPVRRDLSYILSIEGGNGEHLVVRCSSSREMKHWLLALQLHTQKSFASSYVQPWPIPDEPALIKDTVVIDIGSASTRAGILCTQPTLPQLFFPSVMAINPESNAKTFGVDALKPMCRTTGTVVHPVRASANIAKAVDISAVVDFVDYIFRQFNINPRDYNLVLSIPRFFSKKTVSLLIDALFKHFGVKGINMTQQSVLALYSYNASSGIVVDIGERMDIVPINEGYIVDTGVRRVPYGGTQLMDSLRHYLYEKPMALFNEVDHYLVRYLVEKTCYCALDYKKELEKFQQEPSAIEATVPIKEFHLCYNNLCWESITLDSCRFKCVEGLFKPTTWGCDNDGVHKLVNNAIQGCGMDIRKQMSRSIFLSGGVTMLPGFTERLSAEVKKLVPIALSPKIQIHNSPYRYHAAFLGACVLANSAEFDKVKITNKEWINCGPDSLHKLTL